MVLMKRAKLCCKKKPRKNSPLVSALTQRYQGAATAAKANPPYSSRWSRSKRQRRCLQRNKIVAAIGKTTPTGPLASTASAEVSAADTNQSRPVFENPSQKMKNVSSVNKFRSASGLAKWAAAQNNAVEAKIKPASSPAAAPNN